MSSTGPAGAVPATPAAAPATGRPDPGAGRRPSSGRRGYWIPAVIATTVLVAIGIALGVGDLDHGSTSTLHGAEVAQQVALAIQTRDGSRSAPDVRCPASEPVRDGLRFACSVVQGGSTKTAQVQEIDGRGDLRILSSG